MKFCKQQRKEEKTLDNRKTLLGLADLLLWKWPYWRQSTHPVQCLTKPNGILHRLAKAILKFIWKHKITKIGKTIISRKSKARSIIPDIKLYNRAIQQNQQRTGTNTDVQSDGRIRGPRINLNVYSHLIFYRDVKKKSLGGKNILLNK